MPGRRTRCAPRASTQWANRSWSSAAPCAPLAAFGPAATTLPAEWLRRGVILDCDGASILRERGVDMAAADGIRRIGSWRLYRNAGGGQFAICDKGWMELDCREATHDAVPFREIWRFFTGEDM